MQLDLNSSESRHIIVFSFVLWWSHTFESSAKGISQFWLQVKEESRIFLKNFEIFWNPLSKYGNFQKKKKKNLKSDDFGENFPQKILWMIHSPKLFFVDHQVARIRQKRKTLI